MAFRQHNPNVLHSRQKGGPNWKGTKPNGTAVPFHSGAKSSLPSVQHSIQHPKEQAVSSEEASLYCGTSLFSPDVNPHHDKANVHHSTKVATALSKYEASGLYRIPALNRNSLRPGIHNTLRTGAQRLSPDPFRLEKLSRLEQNSASSVFVDNQGALKSTGFTNYVGVARSSTANLSATAMTTLSSQIFKDGDVCCTHSVKMDASSPSKTAQAYVHKFHSLSNTGDCRSAKEAEVLLLEMISKYKSGLHDFQPDGGCYNSVIHAYAEAGLPNQAENVMRLMFSDFKNGNMFAEPNVRCLTNVLHAWRKSKDPDAPERCEALLTEMYELGSANSNLPHCKPDTFAVTVLLHCWVESNRSDACEHAEDTFRKMKKRFHEGDESMRPDCISYSILLNTYAQKMMIDEAEGILWEMVDDYTLYGNKAAEPRTRNFNTVIAMYARSPIFDAPERAEKVLRRYRDLCCQNLLENKPDEYSYSLLLKAWSTSKRDDGINQALTRLNWMRQLDEDAAFPDMVKYTTIISAFARKRDVNGAEALLHRMVKDYIQCKDNRVMPDVPLFDNVIKAFTTPDFVSSSSAFRAESLMRNMWYLYTDCGVNVRPKGTTYKHVIIGFKKAGMALRADEILWEMEHRSVAKPPKELIQTVMNAWHDSTHPEKQKRINTLRLFMNDRFSKGKA